MALAPQPDAPLFKHYWACVVRNAWFNAGESAGRPRCAADHPQRKHGQRQ
ncbi:hypothetical protein ABIC02_007516 [Bradyrhizobium sp. RT5a]